MPPDRGAQQARHLRPADRLHLSRPRPPGIQQCVPGTDLVIYSYQSIYKYLCQSSYVSIYFSISADNPEYSKFVPGSDKSIYLYTADFIEKVFGVYTRSMLTIYLSLRAQVAVGTIFMK